MSDDGSPASLPVWTERVLPEWIDYNHHLSEAYYVLVFGHATDTVMANLGMTPDYVEREQRSLFTLQAHVRYLDQVGADAELEVRSAVIGVGTKSVWLWHELFAEGRLRATEEILAVHVDTESGRSAPLPAQLVARLEELCVPAPSEAGASISLRR